MLLHNDALGQVTQQFFLEVVVFVVDVFGEFFCCEVLVDLGPSFESVAVIVTQLVEVFDLFVFGFFNLLIQHFAVVLQVAGRVVKDFEVFEAVFEVLEFVKSNWFIANDSGDVVFLYIRFGLE